MALRSVVRTAMRIPTTALRTPLIPLGMPLAPSRTLQLLNSRSLSSSSRTLRAPAPNPTGTHAHSPLVPKGNQAINRPAKTSHQFWYREVFPCECCTVC